MSDFIYSSEAVEPGLLQRSLVQQLGFITTSATEYHGPWGSLAVVRAAHDDNPVFEDESSLSVVIGLPIVRLAGAEAEPLSSSNRADVHLLLGAGKDAKWDGRLDGMFAALHVDKQTGAAMVVTDLFAWIPVFTTGTLLGTHVDAVARSASAERNVDEVAVVDRIAYSTVTWPYTIYRAVTQLPPASTIGVTHGRAPVVSAYWQPLERNDFASIDEAASALRAAIASDVRCATHAVSRIGVLLSGGEDSRALLGALPDRSTVTAFTYAPTYNREVRSAARIARAYGVAHVHGRRPETHDLEHFEQAARLASSQNAFRDVHGYGLHEQLGLDRLPIVLGALSSDALLKADNIPPKLQPAVKRGGSSARAIVVHQLAGVRRELLEAAAARRREHRAHIAGMRPASADEWRYIWPFTMRSYAANVHGNRRLFRSHEPFMSNAVVKIAATVPQQWKVERQLFWKAVRPWLRPSWHIPHSRNRLPYFSARFNLLARPLLGLGRDLRAAATGKLAANQESWPIWQKLVQTELMATKLAEYPVDGSSLSLIFENGTDPKRALREWTALRQLNALQLSFLTK